MISVIIPVYNTEKYLRKCILSILNQRNCEIEIILIDDESTDESGIICDEFETKYENVKTIHQKNSGASIARNVGIDNSTGDYVSFIDSDDFIDDGFYSNMEKNAVENDADLVICNVRLNFDKSMPIIYSKNKSMKLCGDQLIISYLRGDLCQHCVCPRLYRRTLIGNTRFTEKVVFGEDVLFNYEVFSKSKISYYNSLPMYNYMIRKNSIMHSEINVGVLKRFDVWERILPSVEKCYPNAVKYCLNAINGTSLSILLDLVDNDQISNNDIYLTCIKKVSLKNIVFDKEFSIKLRIIYVLIKMHMFPLIGNSVSKLMKHY